MHKDLFADLLESMEQAAKMDRAYPEDRGMPSAEALRAYGVQDSDIEIIDTL